jgi:hypothetical protein
LALMLLAPPLLLLAWAHLLRPMSPAWEWAALIGAGLVGIAGAATGPWPEPTKLRVVVGYVLLALLTLPFLALFAVCSTGDCL